MKSTYLLRISILLTLLVFASCADNSKLEGLTIRVDTSQMMVSEFSSQLVKDLKATFTYEGLIVTDSLDAKYCLVVLSATEYSYAGEEVELYERCTDCDTGEEISTSTDLEVLYSDGYAVECTLSDAHGNTLLDQTIMDEAYDRVKDFTHSCDIYGRECTGTKVTRGLLSNLDPPGMVSREVFRAMRRHE